MFKGLLKNFRKSSFGIFLSVLILFAGFEDWKLITVETIKNAHIALSSKYKQSIAEFRAHQALPFVSEGSIKDLRVMLLLSENERPLKVCLTNKGDSNETWISSDPWFKPVLRDSEAIYGEMLVEPEKLGILVSGVDNKVNVTYQGKDIENRDKSLIIMTPGEFYSDVYKSIIGVSLLIIISFLVIFTYKRVKIIEPKIEKDKSIIIFNHRTRID